VEGVNLVKSAFIPLRFEIFVSDLTALAVERYAELINVE
jgi:hypothetical protein